MTAGGLLGLLKGSGGSGQGSGYGGYGPGPGYGGGYGQPQYGGYGQQPVYAQQGKKQGGMGGAGMLAAGNYSVSRFVPQSGPYAISHLQVPVLVCWEVCSSPTP